MNDISILAGVCAMNGILVMVRQSNGKFRIIGDVPGRVNQFDPNLAAQDELIPGQIFPFLENFLEDPESIWLENRTEPLILGLWTEIRSGNEFHLEASAVCIEQNQILLIEAGFENEQRYLQQVRENLLRAYKTSNEVANHIDFKLQQLRDISSNKLIFLYERIKNTFESLDLQISRRNQGMNKYREIMNKCLPIFEKAVAQLKDFCKFSAGDRLRAKIKLLEPFVVALQEAPDVFLCAKEVVDIYRLSGYFLVKRALQLDRNIDQTQNWKVVAEKKELKEVLYYLVENVVSSSQDPSTITVGIHGEGDFIITTIGNQGTGIEPEIASTFSYKLDFGRITIERWGGTINVYDDRPEGGSGFRFCLPKLVAPR